MKEMLEQWHGLMSDLDAMCFQLSRDLNVHSFALLMSNLIAVGLKMLLRYEFIDLQAWLSDLLTLAVVWIHRLPCS